MKWRLVFVMLCALSFLNMALAYPLKITYASSIVTEWNADGRFCKVRVITKVKSDYNGVVDVYALFENGGYFRNQKFVMPGETLFNQYFIVPEGDDYRVTHFVLLQVLGPYAWGVAHSYFSCREP